jgi:hypothetical protein
MQSFRGLDMAKLQRDEQYSDEETARRRDATIKRMLATPPKPHSEMKVGKSRRKSGKSLKSSAQPKK